MYENSCELQALIISLPKGGLIFYTPTAVAGYIFSLPKAFGDHFYTPTAVGEMWVNVSHGICELDVTPWKSA